jgi:hypothetical protein
MAKPELACGILHETEYREWDEFASSAASGSIYAQSAYLDALCRAAGGTFRVVGVKQGGQLVGGVGLYETTSSHGKVVSPRLLLYYNGPVIRRHETKYPSEQTSRELKILAAIDGEIERQAYDRVVLKPRPVLRDVRPFLEKGWTAKNGYTYEVAIGNLEEARSRIEQNLRRLIDRCGRSGFTVSADEDFDSFFRLHASTMERVDFRTYLPERSFRQFYETLRAQGLAQLYHARAEDGQAVATQLVLLGHSVTHTVSAGADPAFMKTGVTAFLRWKVFEALSEKGHQGNDLTDAALNPVTHFKSQLGGSLEAWIEVRSPESPRFRRAERLRAVERTLRGGARAVVHRVRSFRERGT